MNLFTKKNLAVAALAVVAVGMLRKYSMKPENKDSFITTLATTVGINS